MAGTRHLLAVIIAVALAAVAMLLDVTVPDGSKLFAEDVRLDAANERRRSRQR